MQVEKQGKKLETSNAHLILYSREKKWVNSDADGCSLKIYKWVPGN
jgi:hypothetical protein